jgi:glycosyltransferase involved in cell wall biosynthesis
MRVGISTQTPLLRLEPAPLGAAAPAARALIAAGHGLVQLGRLTTGHRPSVDAVDARAASGHRRSRAVREDLLGEHDLSPGGVNRMVLQSLRVWRKRGLAEEAHWFCLQPHAPRRMELVDEKLQLHHLALAPRQLAAYARTKEKLWSDIHGLPASPFDIEDFRFYARYNGLVSDAILSQAPDLDVAYVHDFQLLQVGAMVGLAAPCVLRWHVPFDPAIMPRYTRHFLVRMMEAYDGVIVNTRRELQGLTNAGYHGRVRLIYPHGELAPSIRTTNADVQGFCDRFDLAPDAPVILCVARMDPIKRQDVAIRALKSVRAAHPGARLVLIGNGSFSASRAGGLGLPKAHAWRARLERVAESAGVSDAVVFTGWLPDVSVAAAYARADLVVLPSDIEGFGLTPYEAWARAKPVIVSNGCGVAEMIQPRVNGLVFSPGDATQLARSISRVLAERDAAEHMGEMGRLTLKAHRADVAAAEEAAFLSEVIDRYRGMT